MCSPQGHTAYLSLTEQSKKKKLALRSKLGPLLLFTTVALSVLPLILKTQCCRQLGLSVCMQDREG